MKGRIAVCLAVIASATAEQVMTFEAKKFAPLMGAMPMTPLGMPVGVGMGVGAGVTGQGPMVGGIGAEMTQAANPKLACHCGTDPATKLMRCSCADKRDSTSWNPNPEGTVGPSTPAELAAKGGESNPGAMGAASMQGGGAATAMGAAKPTSAYTRRMMMENGILTDKDLLRRMMGWKEKPVVLKVSDEPGADGLKEQSVSDDENKDADKLTKPDGSPKITVPYTFDAARPQGLRCQAGMDCVKIKMECETKETFECAKHAACCHKNAMKDKQKWELEDLERVATQKREQAEKAAFKKKVEELNKREENIKVYGIRQAEKDKLEALVKTKEEEVKTKRAELEAIIKENIAKKAELKEWRLAKYAEVSAKEAALNKRDAELKSKELELEKIKEKINTELGKRRDRVTEIIQKRERQVEDKERELDTKFEKLKAETRDALDAKDLAEKAFNTPLPPPESKENDPKKAKAPASPAGGAAAPKPQVRVMVEPIQDQRKGEGQSVIDYSVTPASGGDAIAKHTVRIKTSQSYPEALVQDEVGKAASTTQPI